MLKFISSFLLFLIYGSLVFAQPFKFHYILKSELNYHGDFLKKTYLESSRVYFGVIDNNPSLIRISRDTDIIYTYAAAGFFRYEVVDKIKSGKIQINDSHDTLFLFPWYQVSNPALLRVPGTTREIAVSNDSDYCFRINWAATTNSFGFPVLKIPFYYSQFTVTSLPFRFNIKDRAFSSDFLNANISYLFIFGNTKFFQSKFLEPRSNYWGFGPYIGASTIGADTARNQPADIFGFNYGVNVVRSIRNIDLSIALGAESGFTTRYNSFIPYWGVGLGLKLIEFYEPENKKE